MVAINKKVVVILFGLVVAIACCADAQTICNMTYVDLMACKPAAMPPNPPLPTNMCCAGVSHADLKCFCKYKKSTILPSIGVDPKLAMELPGKCNLPHPPTC
ncbi:putative lipid-transfer protein DIR1 [Rhodamnia argentea]|uniref:Lipid-transfer protein DIR1 n=1 Tax=Rhodamnia argentea TaxID=178133 RepID=A0A8B8N242_9MYRT|nr:putative lipid-transfer protein DIR1 [Rhodamnia argentea]